MRQTEVCAGLIPISWTPARQQRLNGSVHRCIIARLAAVGAPSEFVYRFRLGRSAGPGGKVNFAWHVVDELIDQAAPSTYIGHLRPVVITFGIPTFPTHHCDRPPVQTILRHRNWATMISTS